MNVLVDYFLRELEGKTLSESIKYLLDLQELFKTPEATKKQEINVAWDEYLTDIAKEYEWQDFLRFSLLQKKKETQCDIAWDFHDIEEKGNSYKIGRACRIMAEERQDREAAYEWVYYKNILPVKNYTVFTKWVTYFWPIYYANYTI